MITERFTIHGDLAPRAFAPWIERHARRLGVRARIVLAAPGRIVVDMAGPAEMLDAMEMGCLLGPMEVWVEEIRRAPAAESEPA